MVVLLMIFSVFPLIPNSLRHYSAAGSYCTSDDCALTAAHQATYDNSACR